MNKTIVLAGDRNYTRQLETTIKSILYHNRDVKIYILNQDIMPDWFRKPRKIARMLGSEIIDVKLPEQTVFQDWEKQDHISSITYARYFIADYIQEDKVLYLDSDLIVNTSLEKLFSICLEEKSLAAVKDTDGITFNTGVLLINNEKWRQEKLKERLIEQSIVTMKEVEEGRFEHFNGDQTIFNQVLQDDWLELGRAYNLQVGHDIVALYNNWQEHLAFNDKPVVIHFTTYRKPWTTLTANRYRDLWWEFHDLEWSQILQHHMGEFELISPLDKEFSCLTLTNSQDLEGIEELVTALPDVVFHIAAWTNMGDKLIKLAVYDNVRLHPQIVPPVLEKLKRKVDIYLDIHQGAEVESILRDVRNFGIPILSFSNTQHGMYDQIVFDEENINLMIEAIKDYASHSRFLKDYNQETFHCLIFTDTQDIEQLDYLAQYLPHVIFDVAAWTDMGPKLYELQNNYQNIRLYPAITSEKLEQLKVRMGLYLDISCGHSTHDVVNSVYEMNKIIFSFESTQHDSFGQLIYSSKSPERMVEDIKNLISGTFKARTPAIIVKDINQTLDYIIENQSSIIRFGDGEMDLMLGKSIPYQVYDENLASQLKEIISLQSDKKLVIGLPNVFANRSNFTSAAEAFWKGHLEHHLKDYLELARGDWYGTTFVSRPYIDYVDKSQSFSQFEKLKQIWKNEDILIVEGITSRSGVGNDLFDKVKSVKRIICPSHNAYSVVDNIQEEIMKHAEGRLILCMLGPTAKVLSYNLCQMGYQVLDVGHIDSEYEWMKMGAKTKVKFSHKHTAEHNFDQDIEFIDDETYNSQIVARILN
ncbi:TPA: SP_1767 family glycosyltransferase [Streptococcus pneumoniae]|nr:SP_1767 family glycosyltransferase [Streptococcus pneumoniae]